MSTSLLNQFITFRSLCFSISLSIYLYIYIYIYIYIYDTQNLRKKTNSTIIDIFFLKNQTRFYLLKLASLQTLSVHYFLKFVAFINEIKSYDKTFIKWLFFLSFFFSFFFFFFFLKDWTGNSEVGYWDVGMAFSRSQHPQQHAWRCSTVIGRVPSV